MGLSWRPANQAEQTMAEAMASADSRTFFEVVRSAPLYLPAFAAERDEPGQRFVVRELFGRPYLLVFTSAELLADQTGGVADAYVRTDHAELCRSWPDPDWWLAINHGSGIDAYLSLDAVEQAARGETTVPTGAALVAAAQADAAAAARPPEDVDADLEEALARRDVDGYLRALRDAVLLVPTSVAVERLDTIAEPGFPWLVRDGEPPTIDAFTSRRGLRLAYPAEVASVSLACAFALAVWPDGCGVSVNPGSPSAMSFERDHLRAVLLAPDA